MARLTDQEKQEILRYMEEDKPLPDKYRFLLFEDKREVELVWNGKTNEVCNVVLPFQTIERLTSRVRKRPSSRVPFLKWIVEDCQDKGWTNKLIWGDNKLILSSLKNGPMREEIERQGGRNSFILTLHLMWALTFQWILKSAMKLSPKPPTFWKK